MSDQHTQEPWAVSHEVFDNDGVPETVITGLDGRAAIAVTIDFGPNNPGMREANARRIVACVNACAGIATHELELMTGALSILNQISHKLPEKHTAAATKYRKQRDELLDALESMAHQHCRTDNAGMTDSGAITANAEALLLLEEHKRFRVKKDYGRMVCGHWPEHDPNVRQTKAKEGAL